MAKPLIVFEDDILLVCNKPAGLMVEPDRNNFANLQQQIKNYLRKSTGQAQPYAQHLHRLDRPTSGLVLFTKNKTYLKNLSEQFAQRTLSKYYIALTRYAPKQKMGILEHWLRKEKKKAVVVAEGTLFAEKAKLEYSVGPHNRFYKWDIKLHTGKYHQIRVQLAELGCPILGDKFYGSTELYQPNAIALHAVRLVIQHPLTQKEITFMAPAPAYFMI